MTRTIAIVIALCMGPVIAHATTYIVDPNGTGDYPTIQAAIDAALPGDSVELVSGVYRGDGNRDVDLRAKAITVRSQAGEPSLCTIDCQGSSFEPHRGFRFASGEGSGSVLEGMTIRNGFMPSGGDPPNGCGAAVLCISASSPTIQNCVLTENSALLGGAIYCEQNCSPLISRCIFDANTASLAGGVFCRGASEPVLTECLFIRNSATSDAGALDCHENSQARIEQCTFIANTAPMGGAIQCISRRR